MIPSLGSSWGILSDCKRANYLLSPRPDTLILLRSRLGDTPTEKGLLGMGSPP